MKNVYEIKGKYKNSSVEVIDETDTEQDANYLLNEYQIAFGSDWLIWID